MSAKQSEDVPASEVDLELKAALGFGGTVPGGLVVQPNHKQLVYPLGSTVVMRDMNTGKQCFLQGHTNTVSCIAVSKSGRYAASGQITHMGFSADIIVWDMKARKIYQRLVLHKVKVQALAFSPDDKYLLSLGGEDDNNIIMWDILTGEAICGSPAAKESTGTALACAFANTDATKFATGGSHTLRIWTFDEGMRKIIPQDCQLGQLKRVVKCIKVSEDDQFMYCGTTSGDVLQVSFRTHLFKTAGPVKDMFSLGVLAVCETPKGDELLVGAGDGTVAVLRKSNLKVVRRVKVAGAITSVTVVGKGSDSFYVGTARANMYKFSLSCNQPQFDEPELIITCHYDGINDVAFPSKFEKLFATCSVNDIRVWSTETCKELLRITVPNLECHAVVFMPNGKGIISGWTDGKIRAFSPESGKLMYTIHDAHNEGVTAIAVTGDSNRIVSGGGDGQIRVWNVSGPTQHMVMAMKEHKGLVSHIQICKNNELCVSASHDGSCIIWDITRGVRSQVMFANTMFRSVCYLTDESQVITCGTDRKIGYWEVYDGQLIRELEGSQSGAIHGLDIASDGHHFVTGGVDKLIKVWDYNEGDAKYVGTGHSGDIIKVKVCPKQENIVSVSSEGAIYVWKYPFPLKA